MIVLAMRISLNWRTYGSTSWALIGEAKESIAWHRQLESSSSHRHGRPLLEIHTGVGLVDTHRSDLDRQIVDLATDGDRRRSGVVPDHGQFLGSRIIKGDRMGEAWNRIRERNHLGARSNETVNLAVHIEALAGRVEAGGLIVGQKSPEPIRIVMIVKAVVAVVDHYRGDAIRQVVQNCVIGLTGVGPFSLGGCAAGVARGATRAGLCHPVIL